MKHTLSILLQNESGALMRVAGLFAARHCNIDTLTVAATEDPAVSQLTLVLRTSGDPMQAAQPLVQHVRALRPDVPVKTTTMEEALGLAVAAPRFRTILLGLFAGVALLLAMAGIYGVVSFSVSQRTSEIGLRMALGAQRSEIVRLTVVSGLRLTAIGVVAGCAAALAMSQVVSSMLFETTARDPLVFVLVATLLLVVAAVASMAPAIRAARIDPMAALRGE